MDYDGKYESYGPIAIDNRKKDKLLKVITVMGQTADENTRGILFEIYENGDTVRIFK